MDTCVHRRREVKRITRTNRPRRETHRLAAIYDQFAFFRGGSQIP